MQNYSGLELVNLVNQLRSCGAQIDFDIPSIVVAGNQSVGKVMYELKKSSLLSQICGFSLPKGDGTCTKSCTEIRLQTKGTKFKCRISIRREFGESGQNLEKVEESYITETEDPFKVADLIKKAEKCILNPSMKIEKVLASTFKTDELLFTPNIVIVEVEGSPFDLSLTDLPGIIKSVSSEKQSALIQMIEKLVYSHISRKNCKDEMENQAIFHMARQVDPMGLRTVGVLTKPDTIEGGTGDKWVSILTGGKYALKLGYFIVKLPSKIENDSKLFDLNAITLTEREFFETSPIFRPFLLQFEDRFGSSSLALRLTSLLTSLIEASIPEMKKITQSQIEIVEELLEDLPPSPSSNYKIEILQAIRHFAALIGYHIQAERNLKVFSQKVKRVYEGFKDSVLQGRPGFVGNLVSEKAVGTSSSGLWFGSKGSGGSPPARTECLPNTYSIDDLKQLVQSQKGRELDGHSPYSCLEYIVRKSQQGWKQLLQSLVSSVNTEISSLADKLGAEVFGRFPNLKNLIQVVIVTFTTEIQKKTLEICYSILAMEMRSPFTMNSKAFLKQKTEASDGLLNAYQSSDLNLDAMKKAIAALGEAGFRGFTPIMLLNRLNYTSDTHLLDLMASCISYFDICSSRFVDRTCMSVDYYFLEGFSSGLEKELVLRLQILEKSDDDLKIQLMEDQVMVKKREKLLDKRERLSIVLKSLHDLAIV